MLPISIILVSAEVGQARLRVKPGDDSRVGVKLSDNALAIAAVTVVGRLLRNADHAFDSSHHAADHTAHHGTDHSADRTGRALTYGGALLASTNNALGLGRERHGKSGSNDDGYGELYLHEQTPPLEICGFDDRRMDLIRHYGATARRMRPLSIKIAAALAAMCSDHGPPNALSAGTLAQE
jgi:hypothetical protein